MPTSTVRLQDHWKARLQEGLLCIMLALGLFPNGTVSGHASLLGSSPADGDQLTSAPTELVLDFTEPVGVVDGGTTLHSAGSDPIPLTPKPSGSSIVVPLDNLDHGAYIVQWRVISADSHPISGTVSFSVGDSEIADASELVNDLPGWIELGRTVSVALKYLGLLAAFGLIVTGWMIARSDLSTTMRLTSAFSVVAVIGLAAEIPFAAMVLLGRATTSIPELWDTIGVLNGGVRSAAWFGIPLTIAAAANSTIRSQPLARTALSALMLGGALLTLLLSGHTRTREPVWLMMLSDAIHVLVAAIWLGGVIILALGLTGTWRGATFATSQRSAAAVSRFSSLAGYTAALVIASGLTMALIILESLDSLINTDYGLTLLLKVGLVGLVVILAAANRYRLIPMIESSGGQAMTWLRRLVLLELVFLIGVVGATSSLVHLDPNVHAEEQLSESVVLYDEESTLDAKHTIHLTISQSPGGELDVAAHILDEDGSVVSTDADLVLQWSLPAQNLGPITQTVEPDSESGVYVMIVSLPATGDWKLEVGAQIDRFTDSRTTIDVLIPD